MYPILLTLGGFTLSSYNFFLTSSFIVMFGCALRRAGRFGVPREVMLNVSLLAGVSMWIGSGAWYRVLHAAQFAGQPARLFNVFSGGLASVGGVGLGVLVLSVYLTLARRDLRALFDAGAPGFLLSSAIGRVGCFLGGCCYGTPTDSLCGVVYPAAWYPASPYSGGTALWPAPLFAAGIELCGFGGILWLERRHYAPGATFLWSVLYYLGDRFLVEQVRYYPPEQILAAIGPLIINDNHPLLFVLAIFAVILWRRGRRPAAANTVETR